MLLATAVSPDLAGPRGQGPLLHQRKVPFFFVVGIFGVERSNSETFFGWSHQERTELWLIDFLLRMTK